MTQSKSIIVLGAGVIGLTTALKLQEAGYGVTIIAEIFPTDPKNVKYTSQWAGAHHVSFSPREDMRHALDRETFEVMWKMSEENGEAKGCFMRLQQSEFFGYERPSPSPLEHMPEFRTLEKEELIPGAVSGETFKTITIDVPVYLNYLLSKFLSRGGKLIRGSVQHLSQLTENGTTPFLDSSASSSFNTPSSLSASPPTSPDAVIVCAGLGALTLGGLTDTSMYPIRGQTILLNAPHIRFGRTFSNPATNTWTYVIPRRNGQVIVGGTLGEEGDWYPRPRAETTRDILGRVLKMCPEIVPLDLRRDGKEDEEVRLEDVVPMVAEEGCGFRPGRKGGVRLEVGESVKVPGSSGKSVPVVYNYGHAGAGYIASFGCARVVVDLVKAALKD